MADALFAFAVLCGCLAAYRGNRTAWALLASAATTTAMSLMGAPFNVALWFVIDLVVIVLIARPSMPSTDKAVLALFPVAWIFYAIGGWAGYYGTTAVVSAQFMLTVPWSRIWHRAMRSIPRKPWRDFDLKVAT